jgi:hypothetical protein
MLSVKAIMAQTNLSKRFSVGLEERAKKTVWFVTGVRYEE